MVFQGRRVSQGKRISDDDIDSYLEAQLVADIKLAKTREVKPRAQVAVTSGKATVEARKKFTPVYECYESVIADDHKIPNN